LWFYPTIGAAIAAGLPWLSFSCPACGQFGSVDLRRSTGIPARRFRASSRQYRIAGVRREAVTLALEALLVYAAYFFQCPVPQPILPW
jgi:hypothetical protein